MANQEHLDILAKGVDAWNVWRQNNDGTVPDLRGAYLSGAILYHADLTDANLSDANLTGANLSDADLSGAILYQADLGDADLRGVDLRRADLNGANLNGADLNGARCGNAYFVNVDLSAVLGLDDIRHLGPSHIGIDTIYRSEGKIPESFLRGCGVPDNFITYMRSLTGSAFEFYSCFISYSSRDEQLAQRLHADLQAKAVHVWYAPEDLKIGDKFRARIDESIRIHDKLLLVLSENSIRSPWVEKEVETAFERERRENRTVLFPIRLDNAVMETNEAWAADIRRTRHIGDFTKWEQHSEYTKAFNRLLRDLKAQPGEKAEAQPAP